MLRNLFRRKGDVGCDDDEIARPGEQRCGAIDLDLSRLAVDRIGGKAGAVGDVEDIDLLELRQPRRPAQGAVDGDGAFVVAVGGRDGGPVDFGAEKRSKHGRVLARQRRADRSE